MLDLKFIKENKEKVIQNVTNRKVDPGKADVEKLLQIYEEQHNLQIEVENLRSERNKTSKSGAGEDREKGKKLKDEIKSRENKLSDLEENMSQLLAWIPNILSDDTPVGKDENDNVDIKVWLPDKGYLDRSDLSKGFEVADKMPRLSFSGKDHVELGKKLDIIDIEQSAVVSGSRFCYLKKDAVLLQYAIFNLLFEELMKRNFIPMIVPLLVKEKVLFGTSHFPEGVSQVYKIEKENVEEKNQLYLVGSSEPPLFAYGMGRKFIEKELPFKMCAYTSCFRSEVGSWGKDVKGIKRVHQFDKLEMDVICLPQQSGDIFNELISINEWLMQSLKLPYRVIQKCSADAGYAASHKQYDVEVWRMAVGEFMETMTDTNATDYQARRLDIRYQKNNGEKGFCYTVNDTGVAMGRIIVAILENYQNEDGTVTIPEVLRKWMGKEKIEKN